jgi:hypothetical protein
MEYGVSRKQKHEVEEILQIEGVNTTIYIFDLSMDISFDTMKR